MWRKISSETLLSLSIRSTPNTFCRAGELKEGHQPVERDRTIASHSCRVLLTGHGSQGGSWLCPTHSVHSTKKSSRIGPSCVLLRPSKFGDITLSDLTLCASDLVSTPALGFRELCNRMGGKQSRCMNIQISQQLPTPSKPLNISPCPA